MSSSDGTGIMSSDGTGMSCSEKLDRLRVLIAESGAAVIALSGGTDSTFLASVAAAVPGFRVMALSVRTPYMFDGELRDAAIFCKSISMEQREISVPIPSSLGDNPPERCYLCKSELMGAIVAAAAEHGFETVFDGTNADDLHEYRPGLRALKELGIRSPLAEAGLTKSEIRQLAREAGLGVSDKPSNTCLLTRFPHGTRITAGDLRKAHEAEMGIAALGFTGARVRVHGELVRIEIRREELARMADEETREKITAAIRKCGYRYVTVDLEGYRSGSMDIRDK